MSLLAQIYSALGSDTELGISVDGFTLAGPLVSGFGNRYQLHRCYFVYFYTAVSQRRQYHGSLTSGPAKVNPFTLIPSSVSLPRAL